MAVADLVRIPELGSFGNGEVFELPSRGALTSLRVMARAVSTVGRLFDQVQTREFQRELSDRDSLPDERQLEDLEVALGSTLLEEDSDVLGFDLFPLQMALFLADRFVETMSREDYRLVFAIATPGEQLEVELEDPAILLHEGSMKFVFAKPTTVLITCGAWCIAIARRRGVTVEALAHQMVTSLRNQVEREYREKGAGDLVPEQLDSDTKLAKSDQAIIVLIHGLLSTDVGTFDAFIAKWREDAERAKTTRILGWPHDTLAPIDVNSRDLLRTLRTLMKDKALPVLFVCHSRGGLVARGAAVAFEQIVGNDSLVGCVTFGTPHEGASIANHLSSPQLAYFLSLAAAAKWKRVSRVADVLLYAQQCDGQLPGIEDLQVPMAYDDFQRRLQDAELLDAPPGALRRLALYAVGADHAASDPKLRWLADSIFGRGVPNDLVVGLSSAAPFDMSPRIETRCSHSDYCAESEGEVVTGAVRWAAALLRGEGKGGSQDEVTRGRA